MQVIISGNIALRKPVLTFSGFKESETDFLKLKQLFSGPDFSVYGLQIEIYTPEWNPFCVFVRVNKFRDWEETLMLLIL